MANEMPSHCAVVSVAVLLFLSAIDCCAQGTSQDQPQDASERSTEQSSVVKPQEPPRDHSCTVDAAGIFATPQGQDRQNFNHGGWGFQGGGGFAVTRQAEPDHGHTWYVTANYLYDKFRVRSSALATAISKEPQLAGAQSAHGAFSAVTLDPLIRFALPRHYSPYLVGGFGWLRRGIGFNGANLAPPLLPSASSLYRVASNSGVFDFGAGINFAPRKLQGVMLFTEGRMYHGTAINSGSTLVPISVGVRW